MKRIGLLYAAENTFPNALIERINSKNVSGVLAESVRIDQASPVSPLNYDLIIDRIGPTIPFYQSVLKQAALQGTTILNNPFWVGTDEKFFNMNVALKLGIPIPKTVLLPSKERPDGTSENSFRNLSFPMAWEEMFRYVGFPAFLKPHRRIGHKKVFKVVNAHDLWHKHEETGQEAMMLQQEIKFDAYFRCYYVGGEQVLIMPYEPHNPHHLRYATENRIPEEKRTALLGQMETMTIRLNKALGYDISAVEFAIQGDTPYLIDPCDPIPDADIYSIGPEYFEWVVEAVANLAISKALYEYKSENHLTWGDSVGWPLTNTHRAGLDTKENLITKGKQSGPNTKANKPTLKKDTAPKKA
ncbi:ATP-grasp domain-containing protein [Dyadobacter tibetensis]|uniref:ATP-grasp domain-containing protein n=1 Tax=Dyadobacter tibetensis TaxID=1211851 RepID=UPI000472D093|nr:hypothetical protein [Dyadobacter tibetensis]